ncbi:MAG: YbjN domain-containing protein [Deltaproteobacteria bacterium]|nr:YbjN domain-containing protein [Deltaproteobacteria bacterium]
MAAGLTAASERNKSFRLSRVYLDQSGDPALELDLDMEGGVSEARIRDFIKACLEALYDFLRMLEGEG